MKVVDIWESKDKWERFLNGRLRPTGTRVHSAGAQLAPAGGGPVSGSLVIDRVAIDPQLAGVTARAREDETGTNDDWSVQAVALCAP